MVNSFGGYARFFVAVALFWSAPVVRSELIVNEVLVNEPGGSTNYEWLELFVDSVGSIVLDDYQLLVDGELVPLPSDWRLEPQSFLVVCKKLVSTDGTASFEGRWGDGSGVWGDTPDEAAVTLPIVASFSLVNTGGSVAIQRQGAVVSTISWAEAGTDGYSWERVAPSSQTVVQSVDFDGSTPGVVNSVTPVGSDLGLDAVDATIDRGWTRLRFTVVNRGLETFGEAVLSMNYDETWHDTSGGPIGQFDIPSLEPGESYETGDDFLFDLMYVHLLAVLPADDRLRNNKRFFVAPAEEFPAFQLTELSPRPGGSSDAEWIEIVNRTDQPYDLADWQVGDFKHTNVIANTSIVVEPGQRVVLVRSESLFMDRYPEFAGVMVEPSSWALLNDGGDTALLVDHFGLEADRFGYSSLFDGDYTWCRVENDEQSSQWGRSEQPGGSPGEVNRVIVSDGSEKLSVSIVPDVFSPDGDGIEDSVIIIIDGPDTREFELKIFDRQGRVVRRFDQSGYRRDQYVWYGRSDAGRRLPIGIYILYCEIDGAGSVKKPIVIAR